MDKVTFTSTGLVRRDISIDFSIPQDMEPFEDLADGRHVYFVPLTCLRKWPPLMRLDLRDQHGDPFPLLTSAKNERLDGLALAAMAPDGELKDLTAELLRELPAKTPTEADGDLVALARIVRSKRSELTREETLLWRETLLAAASLGSNLLLWARVEARPSERVIVKIAFENPNTLRPELWRRLCASLSWAPLKLQITVFDMGLGTSYHMQIEPPPSMEIHSAELALIWPQDTVTPDADPAAIKKTKRGRLAELAKGLANTARVRWTILRGRLTAHTQELELIHPGPGEPYAWQESDRAYLYVHGQRRPVGVASIFLAATRHGVRPAAALLGLATTGFLATMTVLANQAVKHEDPTVAALLIVPAILAYVVVSSGEHQLVRAGLGGVRAVVFALGMLPVAAAVVLVAFKHTSGGDVQPYWEAFAICSGVLTLALVLSWLLPPIKQSPTTYRSPIRRTW